MYKNSIVVFIDLLGFSEFVKQNDYEKVSDLIEEFYIKASKLYVDLQSHRQYDDMPESNAIKVPIKFRLISDSVIISMEIDKEDENKETLCIGLLNSIWDLSNELIGLDIIIRGGISYGELYDDGNRIFGKALVEAVELEKKANFPRILLSEKFIKLIDFENPEVNGNPGYSIEKDSDGMHQVTIFGHLIFYANMYIHYKLERDMEYIIKYLDGYRDKIDVGMKNSTPSISDKYKKLNVQYESIIKSIEAIVGKLDLIR
jgi:hypothetical protein